MESDPYSLSALEDIIAPDPVGWFPLAMGWWFVIALGAIWLAYGFIVWVIEYRHNSYRREGVKLIKKLRDEPSLEVGLRRIDEVLKRVAMVSYSRERVASLWGTDWVAFLRSSVQEFRLSDSNAKIMAAANYQKVADTFGREDYLATLQAASAWIREHDRGDDAC
ncbi:DUF4381 domain-containing protein [Rubripirellula amarantea]|uniref:DUF4381 domain-containing protein n=1 Tax=Rubripirellula amarantea TaxID=2527999 RepID=A0A5C5WS22_9BACT|nr:DUF4381 domain-containing protein [Rubripirellula amarantea]MDA8745114.1 DUF4381 domain-containing protein [Rubripirellula amarantea]TWT52961.1 hypothetical protein Pla22_05890 [Rubripirellula amarantea]